MAYIDDELRTLHETICIMVSARGFSLKKVFADSGLSRAYFYKFRKEQMWNPTMKTIRQLLSTMSYSIFDLLSVRSSLDGNPLAALPDYGHEFVPANITRMDIYHYIRDYYPEDRTTRFQSIFHNRDDGNSDIYYSTLVYVAENLGMNITELFEEIYRFSLYRRSYGK